MGIIDEKDLFLREELTKSKNKLIQLEKRKERIEKSYIDAKKEIRLLTKRAVHLGLTTIKDDDVIFMFHELQRIQNNSSQLVSTDDSIVKNMNKLIKTRNEKIRYKKRLLAYLEEFEIYIKLINGEKESIITANHVTEEFNNLLELPDAKHLLNVLNYELEKINSTIKEKPKVENKINLKIKNIDVEISDLKKEIDLLDRELITSNDILQTQWKFLGELQVRLQDIDLKATIGDYDDDIEELEKIILELENSMSQYPENKQRIISLLNEFIQGYLDQAKDSLGVYAGYRSDFDYKQKSLRLRAPKSDKPAKVGSSSIHMFMHLSLFLGLQEHLIRSDSKYVPSWLVLDQPSRPYYGDSELGKGNGSKDKNTDTARIKNMLNILVEFANIINNEIKKNYQIIMLEHIPLSMWKDNPILNQKIHLVEEFRDGNALVRE